jgi:2-keto-4-pentenoate hydratase/2-oxohepta-3-ene-1,7-dioic acid hydratase in catechol pathway
MKLATYRHGGRESFGVVVGDGIVEVPGSWPAAPADLLAALQAGPEMLQRIAKLPTLVRSRLPVADAELLAPLPAPPKVIGLAVNYVEHHNEFDRGQKLPDDPARNTTPRPFLMPATAVAPPGAVIPWPDFSRQIDHEVELAVVIGRAARRVTPGQAAGCIAGYTIANDISARSVTYVEGRAKRPKDDFFDWLHGKWADAFCPLGPWLVTAEEVGDPQDLKIELTVNGEVRQQSSTRCMIFDVYRVVSFISHIMTLVPGDVIATGTPSGVGMATGKLLRAGDVITCRIERIGELTNTLGPAPAEFYTPCAGEEGSR